MEVRRLRFVHRQAAIGQHLDRAAIGAPLLNGDAQLTARIPELVVLPFGNGDFRVPADIEGIDLDCMTVDLFNSE